MSASRRLLATLGVAVAVISLGLTGTSAQASGTKPQRPKAAPDLLVVSAPTSVSFCWSGGPGQRVNLTATIDGYRRVLASATLVKDRRCPEDFPLAARYRVSPPNTPGRHTVYEEVVAGHGFKSNRLFAFNLGIPGTWSPAQRECIDYLWIGPQQDEVIRSGPGLSPTATVSSITSCVSRLSQYTQVWVDQTFQSYLVSPSAIPDARQQLVTGALTEAAFKDYVIAESGRRFPGVASYITSTRSAVAVMQILRETAEHNFETTIPDVQADPLMRTWILDGMPTTLRDAETAIRKDSRWQYTKRGRLTFSALASSLLCAFGRQYECDAAKRLEAEIAKLPPMLPRWPLF